MKRYICLIISLCLVLGSFSFVFATPTSWDTSDQTNLLGILRAVTSYGTGNLFYKVSHLDSTLTTIATDISTIKSYLYDSGHSIGYYISGISSWMTPIYNSIVNSVSDTDIEPIIAGLNEVIYSNGNTSYSPYLKYNNKSAAQWLNSLDNTLSRQGISNTYNFDRLDSNGLPETVSRTANASWINNLLYMTQLGHNIELNSQSKILAYYNSTQSVVNWGNLGTSTFTPRSVADGVYKYLNSIQAPVARLSYVLASEQRIAAQEAAALAEQEVVDDFIDPDGDSSATASDFGSISDLSSGYQQNFGSTASVSGIFDIFDSNNFGWFSSETYQQLDTTVAQRGSSFETPLLDQQLEDISRALGVDYAN